MDAIAAFLEFLLELNRRLTLGSQPLPAHSPEARRLVSEPERHIHDPARIARAKANIIAHAALHDGVITPAERTAIQDQLQDALAGSGDPAGLIETVRLLHETLEPHEIEARIRELARDLDRADRISLLATIERIARGSDRSPGDGPYRSPASGSSDPAPFFRRALGLANFVRADDGG